MQQLGKASSEWMNNTFEQMNSLPWLFQENQVQSKPEQTGNDPETKIS